MHKRLLIFIIIVFPLFRSRLFYNMWFYVGLLGALFVLENYKNTIFNLSIYDKYFIYFIGLGFITDLINNCLDNYWQYLITYIACYIFYFILSNSSPNRKLLRRYNYALLASLTIIVFIVIMQIIGFKAFYFSDIENLNANTNFEYAQNAFEIRYWGPFSSALILSTFFVGTGVYFFTLISKIYQNSLKSFLVFLAFLLLVVLTGSRSGLVIFIFVCLYSYNKIFGLSIKFLVSISAIICLTFFLFRGEIENSYILSRFTTSGGDWRYVAWAKIPELLKLNPLIGTGMWNLNSHLKALNILPGFINSSNMASIGHIENVYFTILVSTGIIGFYFFAKFIFWPLWNNKKTPLDDTINTAGKFAYVAILLCGFFEPSIIAVSSIMTLLFIFRFLFLYKIKVE